MAERGYGVKIYIGSRRLQPAFYNTLKNKKYANSDKLDTPVKPEYDRIRSHFPDPRSQSRAGLPSLSFPDLIGESRRIVVYTTFNFFTKEP